MFPPSRLWTSLQEPREFVERTGEGGEAFPRGFAVKPTQKIPLTKATSSQIIKVKIEI